MAIRYASVTHRVEPKALIEMGGVNHESGYDFSREQLRRLEGAKLFISSAEDVYGGADAAREWHSWARQPKRLEIIPGGEHGTDMLREREPTVRTAHPARLDLPCHSGTGSPVEALLMSRSPRGSLGMA
jgi:hypothetical protein